jgi:hypothetical protein
MDAWSTSVASHPTFTTWERYGLPGMGTTILIDPEGRLVKGDETTLAEKLLNR